MYQVIFLTFIPNADHLIPKLPIGSIVLLIGLIVNLVTFYVFYNVSRDIDSVLDIKRKKDLKEKQRIAIAKLYPQLK